MTNMKATKRAILSSVLATVLCFAMLAGTTFAWFTDTVTSEGNIIQTGSLEVGMYWADGSKDPTATDTTWTDASEGPMYTAKTLWEPGYADAKHIKIVNEGNLALNYKLRIVADGIVGKLADVIDVYYFENASQYANRTDAFANATRLGTLTEVLGTEKNLSKYVNGEKLLPGTERTLSLVLVMNENAGNEYKNTSLGCEFKVELIATQAPVESDSFGTDYDANVPSPEIPAALVRPLEDLDIVYTTSFPNGTDVTSGTLDVGYKFLPTMGRPAPDGSEFSGIDWTQHLPYNPENSVENSEYRYWHADFVVYADRLVPANSMALAGYYSAFCEGYNNKNWVALTAGEDIAAGTEIRLVQSMNGITVNWEEICRYGNDGLGFMCGAMDMSANNVNAGTTLTVELRLYETTKAWDSTSGTANDETGKYITVGEFKYTFPVTNYVSNASDLASELAAGNSVALTEDIVVDSTLNIQNGSKVDIDLNGHDLSYAVSNTGAAAIINNKGDLKIFGEGTISFVAATPDMQAIPHYATNTITNTGNLVIGEGVVVTNGSDGGASYAVDNQSGTFILDGGTLIGERCALRIARFNGDSKFVMNSGLVKAATPAWIHLPGSDAAVAPSIDVTINGGTFQSTKTSSADNDVLYTYSFGNSHANTKVEINGGEFLGGTVSIGSGYKGDVPALTINGGTFEYDVLKWNADSTATVIYAANK